MNRRTVPRALLALLLATTLAACTSGGSGGSAPPAANGSPAPQACLSRAATATLPAGISTDLSRAPTVSPATAPPPCALEIGDVVVGTGAAAAAGSTVAVKYVGAFYQTGKQFDSSWSRGADQTLPVTLGAGQVIPGFEQGISGMKVGGRRVVTIPSDLGYGAQGQGPIPGGATLVFVLDLVTVN